MKIKDFQDTKNLRFLSVFRENNFHSTKQIKIIVQKNEQLSKKMNNKTNQGYSKNENSGKLQFSSFHFKNQ